MSYAVLIDDRVAFETPHLGEAIAFKIGRQAGVIAKMLVSEFTAEEQRLINSKRSATPARRK